MPSSSHNFGCAQNSDLHWEDSIVPQKWTACISTEPAEWLSTASHITHSSRGNPKKEQSRPASPILVADRWKTQNLIGSGSFGDVYHGLDMESGQTVAIKVEETFNMEVCLHNEMTVYKALAAKGISQGFARMYCYEELGHDTYALVLQRLGKSLEEVRTAQPGGRLPLQQVIDVGIQSLDALQSLHDLGFAHCDVKPANLLSGVVNHEGKVYVVDFGLSRKLVDSDGQHVLDKRGQGFVGTALYASVAVHKGSAPSRRCDLESLAYSLSELFQGKLPWDDIADKSKTKKARRKAIGEKKRATSCEELFRGMGKGFEHFLSEVRDLGYEQRPQYEILRRHLLKSRRAESNDTAPLYL